MGSRLLGVRGETDLRGIVALGAPEAQQARLDRAVRKEHRRAVSHRDHLTADGSAAIIEEECPACTEGREPIGTCVDGEFVCECVSKACDFEQIVCQMVEGGKIALEDVVDCGTLTLLDDAAAWEAGQACVLESFQGELAYKVFAEQQGIDSTVWRALGGLVGLVYQPVEYFYDGGGSVGGDRLRTRWRLAGCAMAGGARGDRMVTARDECSGKQ